MANSSLRTAADDASEAVARLWAEAAAASRKITELEAVITYAAIVIAGPTGDVDAAREKLMDRGHGGRP